MEDVEVEQSGSPTLGLSADLAADPPVDTALFSVARAADDEEAAEAPASSGPDLALSTPASTAFNPSVDFGWGVDGVASNVVAVRDSAGKGELDAGTSAWLMLLISIWLLGCCCAVCD